jgi:hypothetical protein
MRFDRIAEEIARRCRLNAIGGRDTHTIGVVGAAHRDALRSLIARALVHLDAGDWSVVALDADALGAGAAALGAYTLGVFTDLRAPAPHGALEEELARMAQLFLALAPGGTALVPEGTEESDLLCEVVPSGVRVVRYRHAGQGAESDLVHEAAVAVIEALGYPHDEAERAVVAALSARSESSKQEDGKTGS